MMSSLSRLQRACNLGVRGREKASDLLGQCLIRGEPGQLGLPQVEIAPRQSIEVACVVVFRSHDSL